MTDVLFTCCESASGSRAGEAPERKKGSKSDHDQLTSFQQEAAPNRPPRGLYVLAAASGRPGWFVLSACRSCFLIVVRKGKLGERGAREREQYLERAG